MQKFLLYKKIDPELAKDATVYITLEPCCHHGRTPPCTDFLIRRKVKKVIYGMQDPNPEVAGRSAAILQAAGIACEQISVPEIDDFYRSYQYWWQHKMPWVTAKIALSLDSKIAAPGGKPIAITGPEARLLTHQWRKRSDALFTTASTIIQDNPELNVRLPEETYGKPVYVLDSWLRTPLHSEIFNTATQLTFFHRIDAPAGTLAAMQERGVNCVPIGADLHHQQYLNLNAIMHVLAVEGVHDLWVEAGGNLFSHLLEANLIQRALFYVAPKFLGDHAITAFHADADYLRDAKQISWQQIGQDVAGEILFV